MTPSSAQFAAAPVVALALLGGCAGSAEPANNLAAAAAPKPAATPGEIAQAMVRRHLGDAQELGFTEAQVFNSQGATIVCGRVSQAGQPAQRYITVGQEDVFVEGQMQPGHMDQAVTEFCRNA